MHLTPIQKMDALIAARSRTYDYVPAVGDTVTTVSCSTTAFEIIEIMPNEIRTITLDTQEQHCFAAATFSDRVVPCERPLPAQRRTISFAGRCNEDGQPRPNGDYAVIDVDGERLVVSSLYAMLLANDVKRGFDR